MSEQLAPNYVRLPFDSADPVACVVWLRRWTRPAPPSPPAWLTAVEGSPPVTCPRRPFAAWESLRSGEMA